MNINYLFQDKILNNEHKYKLIIVKHQSKYKYILELYKKTVDQIKDISSMKLGCFLYVKNNQYCIYDAKNYIIKEFNESSEFLVEKVGHSNIDSALNELFNKKY